MSYNEYTVKSQSGRRSNWPTVTGVVLGAAMLAACTMPENPSQAANSKDHSIFEINVTNLPDTKNGQPTVAINPKDPDNLVFVATIFEPAPGLHPTGECFLARSANGGQTWTRQPWPMGDRPRCGEPNVATDSNGTFYLLNNQISVGLAEQVENHVVVSRSDDGGRTWIGPVKTPLLLSGVPKLRVDAATGKVYAVGGAQWEYPSAVSVSGDRGESWSPPQIIPGGGPCITIIPGRPQACGYPGREIAVYDGVLASASQGDGKLVTFHVSRDDGTTWTNLAVTNSQGVQVPAGTGALVPTPQIGAAADPVPWVSADPTRSGAFAVMVPRDSTLEVYSTTDAGQNWTGPTTIAATDARRPAMDFGPNGELGVMWRTQAVDAYSTVSFDHGASFAAPVKVNAASGALANSGPPGDRWSGITLANGYAYITWSDGRAGLLDGILARVPLDRYRDGGRS